MALRADEVVGIQQQLVEALVPVEIRQVQQRQAGLGGQAQARGIVQLDAGQGAQVLVVEKQQAQLAKALALGVVQAGEDRQPGAHRGPQLRIEGVAGEQTTAAPVAEEHGGHSQ
ncbi:hypothetical protein D3C86_1867330 [compost metagenome]